MKWMKSQFKHVRRRSQSPSSDSPPRTKRSRVSKPEFDRDIPSAAAHSTTPPMHMSMAAAAAAPPPMASYYPHGHMHGTMPTMPQPQIIVVPVQSPAPAAAPAAAPAPP